LQDWQETEERLERFELEKMRIQTAYMVNCQIKDPIRDIRKFMPFPWDTIEVYVPTEIEWEKADRMFENLGNRQ